MKIDIKGVIVSNDDKWIYDWLDMQAVSPRDVLAGIDKAMGEALDVYINSPGGDVFAGSEIYSALRAYTGTVHIHVVGEAASAASMVMCAGQCDITPTGMVMVHNVSGGAQGDYRAMNRSSEVLQKADKAIAAAYTAKTGKPEAEILALMNRETWMTAPEAVTAGLADSITQEGLRLAAVSAGMISQEAIDRIRNTVKRPRSNDAGFSIQKAQAQLDILKFGGVKA